MITSFEPIPSIFEKNVLFHRLNGLPIENVINAAISESNGESEIFLPISDASLEGETTATLKKDSWQFSKKHNTFVVPTMKLDDVLKKNVPSDKIFIKIDVEDYESGVFMGATETFHAVRPVIVCEILPRSHGNKETIEILESNGYVAFGIAVDGLIKFSKNDFIGPRGFTDFLLMHNSIAPDLNYVSYDDINQIKWWSSYSLGAVREVWVDR